MPDKYTTADDFKFIINGYTTIHNNRGRGLCIFIKDSIEFEHIIEYDSFFNKSIVLKIKTTDDELITICLVYRSPNTPAAENTGLLDLINSISKNQTSPKHKLLIIGDFNLPAIDWHLEATNHIDQEKHFDSQFLNCLHENYLFQHVDKATHQRCDQNSSLIDLIITNDPELIDFVHNNAPLGNSHHSVLNFSIPINLSKLIVNNKAKFIYDKGDYVGMRTFVKSTDWKDLFTDDTDVNTWKNKLERVLEEAQLKFIPQKKLNKSNNKSKRTFSAPSTLLTKIQDKRKAFKYMKQFPTDENRKNYVFHRNLCNSEVKKAKREKELKISKESKNNPKQLFRYIASKTSPKEGIANLVNNENVLTTSDLEKCHVLNNFFTSVFVDEGDGPIPAFEATYQTELNDIIISDDEMYKVLNSLNISKSPGPDTIHPKVLKELSRELSHPLKLLFLRTLKDGKLPDSWKVAEVKPIFKKGRKDSPGNYRPVSLTSILCKVFERFVRDALCKHLLDNDLLSKDQFGFCKGRSCISQLLVTINEWLSSLDKKIPVDAAYLDFRKAFDSVPHKRLITKLSGYGVRGPVLAWIHDFLTNRFQYVSINNNFSNKVPVTSGVPQGSVLGPSLFIYFINDLPDVTNCLLKIFADDTKVYIPIESDDDRLKLQKSIDELVKWSERWMIKFNSEKCKILHLGKDNPKHKYYIKEGDKVSVLEETVCEKDLGVNIDPELTFYSHIYTTVKKGRRMIGMILRNLFCKDKEILIPLYKALIRPILEYGNVVWCPYYEKYKDLLEKVQQHFTKRINGMNKLSYPKRLQKLKLPSLEFRRLRGDLIEVYKIVHNLYDQTTTNSLFSFNTDSITRSHSFKLTKPRVDTKRYQDFFTNRVIDNWNKLPEAIVSAKSLNVFKNRIDRHFSEHTYATRIKLS